MPNDIPLRCACNKLRGTALAVSPEAGNRILCYCGDCQAFARFCGRSDIMDAHGGTDIFQMAPGRVRITAGADALQCVRLAEGGLFRWYCGECKTPVGNTAGAKLPFVGLIHSFMDHEGDGRTRTAVLGEPIGHVNTSAVIGRLPPHPHDMWLPRLLARTVRLMATWWVTGAGKPSPFFDEQGAPRSAPLVLTPEQRAALNPH